MAFVCRLLDHVESYWRAAFFIIIFFQNDGSLEEDEDQNIFEQVSDSLLPSDDPARDELTGRAFRSIFIQRHFS